MTLRVEGVAQGLAVDGQRFILLRVDVVPALQGAVEMGGFDADQGCHYRLGKAGSSKLAVPIRFHMRISCANTPGSEDFAAG